MRFENRGILVHPAELDETQLDLVVKAKLNQLGLHPVGGLGAEASLDAAIAAHRLPENVALRAEAGRRGIAVYYEAHALSWLLPRALFDEHPAWFRCDEKGERTKDANLCPSSAEALAYITERAGELARLLDTGHDRYYYWMDDACGKACHCPDCRGMSASDQQMLVMNAVLRGLRRVNPRAQLGYIAYLDAMRAPRNVSPEDGIFLEYAPFHRDFHRPLADKSCEKNVAETAPLKDLLACFGAKGARVLEYWMDNSLYSNWTKPPKPFALDTEVMKADLDFYAALGFTEIASFGCYLGQDYRALHGTPPIVQYGELLSE